MRYKHCLWVWHIATVNPAEGGEGSSLASTASPADTAATVTMSVVASATTVADESCARAVAANDKWVGQD